MNMKFHLFLFTCILICGYASAQNIRQVAGMDLSVAYQEYGGIMAGKSVTGEAARVAGVPYTNVIGTHAKSIIKIDTRSNASLFTAQIAIADNKINYQDTKLISYPLVDGKNTLHDGEIVTCTEFLVVGDGLWCKHQYGWSNARWMVGYNKTKGE